MKKKNRLNLDFTIDSYNDRMDYVKVYLGQDVDEEVYDKYMTRYGNGRSNNRDGIGSGNNNNDFPFIGTPTASELNTIAEYVLYGRDEDTGKSVVDEGYVFIEGGNRRKKQLGSLDAMKEESEITGMPMEMKTGMIAGHNGKNGKMAIMKSGRASLDREVVLGEIGDDEFLVEQFKALWKEIDKLEYSVACYDVHRGKKEKVREELEERLEDDVKDAIREESRSLTIHKAAKRKKALVEMRQQQYLLRDSYAVIRRSKGKSGLDGVVGAEGAEMEIKPLGVAVNNEVIFYDELGDSNFNDEAKGIVEEYLDKVREEERYNCGLFDFRNPEQIALMVYARGNIDIDEDDVEEYEAGNQFLKTFDYYVNKANLSDVQRIIIGGKMKGMTNPEIAKLVNEKCGKKYLSNYISTIFRSQCCTAIAQAAILHEESVKGILRGKKAFKKCNTCGKLMLRSELNFVKKSRASDGLTGRCKRCDKVKREEKSR